jgi:cytochrome c oxidase subunit 2
MTSLSPKPSHRLGAIALIITAVAVNLAISLWMYRQAHSWLPPQASSAAPHVDGLFALETGIGSFLFLGCLEVILWTMVFQRADKYDLDNGAPIEGNWPLEIIWTVIPFVIVMAIAWHAIGVNATLDSLGGKQRVNGADQALQVAAAAQPEAAEAVGPIQVIARQWSWEFIYPQGVHSAELHLPVNRPARFELISLDVLHGFYIPAFRLKQDLIPGSVIGYRLTPTRIGRYRLRDSMFSGGYFASNQSLVVVQSEDDFQAWLQRAAITPPRPSWNAAQELYQRRLARGDRGWAIVPPAPPPLVNVGLDPASPHDA